jgi:hypothetical protein
MFIILKAFCLYIRDRAIAQAVGHLLVTAKDWVRTEGSARGACGRLSGGGTSESKSFGSSLS